MKSLRDIFRRIEADGGARHVLRNFNMGVSQNGKAQSVKKLAEALGFDVQRSRLPRGMAGRLMQDPFAENGYRIDINETLSITAQRFAVLHEIGHYFLHQDHSDPLAGTSFLDRSGAAFYVDPTEEREANQFAATLLFGDGALTAARSLHGDDVQILARYFGVSDEVLKIGLKQFSGQK
jgi:Zn-dependent peptidase ImmA (M78 family)